MKAKRIHPVLIISITSLLLSFDLNEMNAQGLFGNKKRSSSHLNPFMKRFNKIKNRRRGAQKKLFGGIRNILGSPFELPNSIVRQTLTKGAAEGFISGTVDGVSRLVKRAGSGIVDIVTFPSKFPKNSYRNTMVPKGPIRMFQEVKRLTNQFSKGNRRR